jgi:hypothetical protein
MFATQADENLEWRMASQLQNMANDAALVRSIVYPSIRYISNCQVSALPEIPTPARQALQISRI